MTEITDKQLQLLRWVHSHNEKGTAPFIHDRGKSNTARALQRRGLLASKPGLHRWNVRWVDGKEQLYGTKYKPTYLLTDAGLKAIGKKSSLPKKDRQTFLQEAVAA